MSKQTGSIGYIVGGGLQENWRVRLTVPPQEVQEGAFVIIESGDWQFYGLVTDLQLGATDPRFADEQTFVVADLAQATQCLLERLVGLDLNLDHPIRPTSQFRPKSKPASYGRQGQWSS